MFIKIKHENMSKASPTKAIKLAIAGGGPSGLTLAGILGKEAPERFEVTIFERASKFSDQGAGWDVDTKAQASLRRAGVEPHVYQCPGSDNMRFYKAGESYPQTVLRLPPYLERLGMKKAHIGLDECNLETERNKIINALVESLPPSTTVQYDTVISEATQDSEGKMELLGRDGSSLGKFDVVVDASGVSSTLRRTRFTEEADSYYTGKCLLMSTLDNPRKTCSAEISSKFSGTTGFYGPSSDGLGTVEVMLQRFGHDSPRSTLTMTISIQDPQRLVDQLEFEGIHGFTNDPEALQRVKDYANKRLVAFPSDYREMFDGISSAYVTSVKMHPSYEEAMKSAAPGSDELPFLSIGDALHALPPWSGMSGNYSLQDANDLASALIEEHRKGDWSTESIATKFRELEKEFSIRTEDRRKEVAQTSDDKDYMSSTPIKDFALVGRITNKPWSWKDPMQVAIAGFLRFVTFLNRFDNYGVGVS